MAGQAVTIGCPGMWSASDLTVAQTCQLALQHSQLRTLVSAGLPFCVSLSTALSVRGP
jgi:hypothetical protein